MPEPIGVPVGAPAPGSAPLNPVTPTPAPSGTEGAATASPAPSLVQRIAQEQAKQAKPSAVPEPDPAKAFNTMKEELLRGVSDPAQRQLLEQRLAVAERGIGTHFQQVAELKTQLSTKLKAAEEQANQPWSKERVRTILSDPSFVQSSQQLLEERQRTAPPKGWEGSHEEWSNLNDQEKEAFGRLQAQTESANQKVDALMETQRRIIDQQEHAAIQTRFPDYEKDRVESTMRDIINNQVSSETLKEWLHKAITYERAVEHAYRFGLQDRQGNLQEKVQGASPTTNLSVNASEEPLVLQNGERPASFFRRLAERNLRLMGKT